MAYIATKTILVCDRIALGEGDRAAFSVAGGKCGRRIFMATLVKIQKNGEVILHTGTVKLKLLPENILEAGCLRDFAEYSSITIEEKKAIAEGKIIEMEEKRWN